PPLELIQAIAPQITIFLRKIDSPIVKAICGQPQTSSSQAVVASTQTQNSDRTRSFSREAGGATLLYKGPYVLESLLALALSNITKGCQETNKNTHFGDVVAIISENLQSSEPDGFPEIHPLIQCAFPQGAEDLKQILQPGAASGLWAALIHRSFQEKLQTFSV